MLLCSTMVTVKGHYLFVQIERRFVMEERNIQHGQKGRRIRQKRVLGFITPILFLAIIVSIFSWKVGFRAEEFSEIPIIDNQSITNNQDDTAGESTQNDNSQSLNTDIPWNLTLVNRENPIPEDYEVNLVKVKGGERVDERIYEPLMEMLEDAKEANLNQLPMVVSGYRTLEEQKSIYDDKITEYRKEGYSKSEAKKMAEQWVATPGTSEHHLGFAVDINGATYDVYLWLQENSYKYGFILRYPGSKTEITGVQQEVWHYRYVGVEAATEIYKQGICLEEYWENVQK